MANMSYCRFRNTKGDLSDCLNALIQGETMSEEEAYAGKRMFKEFLTFCRDYDIIDSYYAENVDDLFNELEEE